MDPSTAPTSGHTIGIILSPSSVRLAQTLGLTLSCFAAGQTLASSFLTIPAILRLPTPQLLAEARRLGVSSYIPRVVALAATGASAWLASREPTTRTQAFQLYVTGAGFLTASAVWSFIAVGGVEREFNRRNVDAETLSWIEKDGQVPVQKDEHAGTMGMVRRWMGSGNDLFFPILKNAQLSVHELVDRWAVLNAGAGVLMTMGSLLLCWGVVCNETSIFELFQDAALE